MVLNGAALAIGQRSAFRKDVDIVSSTFDRLAYDLLCFSPSIEGSCIDPVHSLVDGSLNCLNGRFFVLWAPPDPPFRSRAYWSASYSDFGDLEIALAKTPSLELQSHSTRAGWKTTRPLVESSRNVIVASVTNYLNRCLGDKLESYEFSLGTKAERLQEIRREEDTPAIEPDEIKRLYLECKSKRDRAILTSLMS